MISPIIPIEKLVIFSGLLLVLGSWLAWRSASKASFRLRLSLTILRILGLVLLAVAAFNPGHRESLSTTDQATWAIMLDVSKSMLQKDGTKHSRLTKAADLATQAIKASDHPDLIRRTLFCNHLYPAPESFKNLLTQNGNTDIAGCGEALLAEFAGTRRLRGILLLSDGRQIAATTASTLTIHAQAQQTPIYAIPLGGKVVQPDLAIHSRRREYIAFKGQPVRLSLQLDSQAIGKLIAPIKIFDSSNNLVTTHQLEITDATPTRTISIELPAVAPGRHIYTCKVPLQANEQRTWNNQDSFEVAIMDKPISTLYIEGQPFWDSKFLMQLLRQQPNLSVESIYHVGKNRFFKVTDSLDQTKPVVGDAFPQTMAAISHYDMIIIGKGCEYFLTPKSTRLLRKFVRDLGGALIFARGKPYHGVFPELQPLEIGEWGEVCQDDLRLTPTLAGEQLGLFGRLLPGRDAEIWRNLPLIHHPRTVHSLHSFTKVLATGMPSSGTPKTTPLIASRRYGKGIILTINTDGIWHWRFMPSVKNAAKIYREMWAQLLNWTITYGEFLPGETLSVHISNPVVHINQSTHIQVRHRPSDKHIPTPLVEILHNGKPSGSCRLTAHPDDPLRWDGIIAMSSPGAYHLKVHLPESNNGPEAILSVLPDANEQASVSADPLYLAKLCRDSGGKIISAAELPKLIKTLETNNAISSEVDAKWISAWDNPAYLILLLIPFALEWFLRRRNGLL